MRERFCCTRISQTASALRRLYFTRFAFAIVWALVTIAIAKEISPLTVVLFVLYPLFDVGAAIYDLRSSRTTGSPTLLYVNIAVSLLAAVGVGVASSSGVPAVLRVWGAWAVVAGLVQLVVGVTRRRMGGQWPMIISGGISTLRSRWTACGTRFRRTRPSARCGYGCWRRTAAEGETSTIMELWWVAKRLYNVKSGTTTP
ncbi:hypothetical protein [Micromonospora taraxaci]